MVYFNDLELISLDHYRKAKEIHTFYHALNTLTGFVEAEAVKYDSAAEAARFLFERVICRYGFPGELISDRGSHFVNSTVIYVALEVLSSIPRQAIIPRRMEKWRVSIAP